MLLPQPVKTIKSIKLLVAFSVMASATQAHSAIVIFSNDLKGYAGNDTSSGAAFLSGSGFEPTTVGVDPTITFNSDGAVFGNSIKDLSRFNTGWQTRNYLRTNEQAHGTIGFTASVTVQRDFAPTPGTDGYGTVYFGLGFADADFFRAPDGNDNGSLTNTTTFLRWQSNPFISWHGDVKDLSNNFVNEIGWANEVGPGHRHGTTRLMMTYDPTVKTVQDWIDDVYNDTFVADQTSGLLTIDGIVDEFANGERSSIFFGSNGKVRLSNFSVTVIPEPSSFLAACLGGLTCTSDLAQQTPPGLSS